MASPLHHQSSIEAVAAPDPVFQEGDRQRAEQLFLSLLEHFSTPDSRHPQLHEPFLRVELVRLMHEYASVRHSKDLLLKSFLTELGVDITTLGQVDTASLPEKIVAFTDYLVENLFLPLKASSAKTPQPTPSEWFVPFTEPSRPVSASSARLKTLRQDCFARDRHRCVISRSFDEQEALDREKRDGLDAKDDDGKPLSDLKQDEIHFMEVAHILPHSLLDIAGDSPRHAARRNALAILDMFDFGVRHLIEGENIDRPTNAITLTTYYHRHFGEFRTVFVAMAQPHTYRIESVFDQPWFLRRPSEPIERTLFLSENKTVDPPHPRLLALHAAIARIMHRSGAGEYCDQVLQDTEELEIKADGTTNLSALVKLRLGGWWNGVVA